MISGVETTRDISKLSQTSYNNFEMSLQIMLLPAQTGQPYKIHGAHNNNINIRT